MADNKTVDNGSLTDIPVATDEVTYSGDTANVQLVRVVGTSGSEGSKTVNDTVTTAVFNSLNDEISLPTQGAQGVVFVFSGTPNLVGTVRMEASFDGGSSWDQFRGMAGHLGGARLPSPPDIDGGDITQGNYAFGWALSNIDDLYATHIRLRVSAFTSGSANVAAYALAHMTWNQDGMPVVRLAGLDNAAIPTLDPTNDGAALTAAAALETISLPFLYNGTTWDRLRGDTLGLHVSRPATSATATLSNVNDTATSTTLLSSNTSRKGATIHNDSTAVLYVKFGTTASATSFTVKMAADAYYEVPFGYTGRIDGIWASDASGAARITEMT